MKGSSPPGKDWETELRKKASASLGGWGGPESASKLVGTGAAQPQRASLSRPTEPCVGTNPRKAQCWETWLC